MKSRTTSLYCRTYLKISYCFEFPLLPYKAILKYPLVFRFPASVTDTLCLQPVQRHTISSMNSSCWEKKSPHGSLLAPSSESPPRCEVRGEGDSGFFHWSWSPRHSDSRWRWAMQGEENTIVQHNLLPIQQGTRPDGWETASYCTCVPEVHIITQKGHPDREMFAPLG